MRILLIETSGSAGSVALADETGLLVEATLPAARKQARDLAPRLQSLLQSQSWKASGVDLVLVDVGPGSYTGLRVGLTTAKTFCYAAACAVVGVAAPRLIAENAPADVREVHVVIDAQQGKIYADRFLRTQDGGAFQQAEPTRIVEIGEWSAGLPDGAYVSGPALARYADRLPERLRKAPPVDCEPRIGALWRVGVDDYAAGRRDDFWTLEPMYLRASSAEIKWDRLHPPAG